MCRLGDSQLKIAGDMLLMRRDVTIDRHSSFRGDEYVLVWEFFESGGGFVEIGGQDVGRISCDPLG